MNRHLGRPAAGAAEALASPAGASASAVVGSWRLLSYQVEVRATGEMFPAMGGRPSGYIVFTPEGRVWFMLTGDGREAGESDQHKALLLESLIAYTGRYRIEGDDWITESTWPGTRPGSAPNSAASSGATATGCRC